MKAEMPLKALAALTPAVIAMPAFAASTDALATSMPLSLEVTFAAYLAVLLGTFVPVTFLIVLYSQRFEFLLPYIQKKAYFFIYLTKTLLQFQTY
jgi:hypothetical protein